MFARKHLRLVAIAFALCTAAQSAILWDNGPANPFAGGYNSTETELADDFSLIAQQTVRSASIWAGDKLFGNGIEYAFYTGGDVPGELLAAGVSTVVYTRDPLSEFAYRVSFDLDAPVTLGPGDYWFSIRERNATPFLSVAAYVTDTVIGRLPHQRFVGSSDWFSSGGPPFNDVAFQLDDARLVPEPSSTFLMIAGSIVFAAAAFKRRAR